MSHTIISNLIMKILINPSHIEIDTWWSWLIFFDHHTADIDFVQTVSAKICIIIYNSTIILTTRHDDNVNSDIHVIIWWKSQHICTSTIYWHNSHIQRYQLIFAHDAVTCSWWIRMQHGITKSHWYISQHAIVMWKWRISLSPILDIHTSDITAGHAARIDQIDKKATYYAQSRWLDEIQARQLIIDGLIHHAFDSLDEDPILHTVTAHLSLSIPWPHHNNLSLRLWVHWNSLNQLVKS